MAPAVVPPARAPPLRAFMTASGAVAAVESRIGDLIDDARRTLARAPIPPAVRHGLGEMAGTAAWRHG